MTIIHKLSVTVVIIEAIILIIGIALLLAPTKEVEGRTVIDLPVIQISIRR